MDVVKSSPQSGMPIINKLGDKRLDGYVKMAQNINGVEDDITGGALYFHSYPNPNDWGYHDSFTQVYIPGTEKFWFYTK